MAEKKIAVIGGSGFIGRYVVQALARAGHRVQVAVRRPNDALFLKPLGALGQVNVIEANVRSLASLRRAMAGADAVVNLVGVLYESGHQSFDEIHAEGAGNVARAAAELGVKHLVHLSALGADAESASAYARSKAAGEAQARAAFPAATIIRPSIVFGPGDGFFTRFAGLMRRLPVLPLIGGGKTRFQPVYVCDVAQAISMAATSDGYAGETYELGGPRVYSFKELLEFIGSEIMTRRPLLPLPFGLAKCQAFFLGLLPNPVLTMDQVELLKTDNVASGAAPGLSAFDIAPTPVEAIVPGYLVPYRPHGQFSRKSA